MTRKKRSPRKIATMLELSKYFGVHRHTMTKYIKEFDSSKECLRYVFRFLDLIEYLKSKK